MRENEERIFPNKRDQLAQGKKKMDNSMVKQCQSRSKLRLIQRTSQNFEKPKKFRRFCEKQNTKWAITFKFYDQTSQSWKTNKNAKGQNSPAPEITGNHPIKP